MRISRLVPVIALFLFIAVFGSSQGKGDQKSEKIIEQGVDLKIKAFKDRKIRNCKEKALERAIVVADSLIRALAYEMNVRDDVGDKPEKPEKPEFKTLTDTLTLRPLFTGDTTGQQ